MAKQQLRSRVLWAAVVFSGLCGAAASAGPRESVYIRCVRNTPTGIELSFEIPGSITVTDLALEKDVESQGVPAAEPFAVALAGLLVVGWLVRRRQVGLGLACVGIAAAGLAYAVTVISLPPATR